MSATGTAPARAGSARKDFHSFGGAPFSAWPQPRASERSLLFHVRSGLWIQLGYVSLDVSLACANSAISFYVRFTGKADGKILGIESWRLPSDLPLSHYGAFLLLYVALLVLLGQSQHVYRTLRERSAARESLGVIWAVSAATLLLTAFIYLSGIKDVSRFVVLLSGALNLVTLPAWRLGRRRLVIRRVAKGVSAKNAIIVGAGNVGQSLASYLDRNLILGYKVKGFLDGDHHSDPRVLGRIEDFDRVIRAEFVDEVFITIPSECELVKRISTEARRKQLNVSVIPELYDGFGWDVPLRRLGGFPVMELHRKPIPVLGLFCKRLLDIVVSAAILVVLSPLFLLLAAAIRINSRGPVFYRSKRIGRKAKEFVCYKFRTMVANADALKEELRNRNERHGPFFKMAADPRVTRVGRFLRRYSLDELPQFWNTLLGEMSLVGPRPHPLDDYERYDLEHLRRLDVKPGITGLWQVTARRDPSFETNMALDLEYIESWSLQLDLKILLKTFPEVMRASGS